jgi:hypothetical protein
LFAIPGGDLENTFTFGMLITRSRAHLVTVLLRIVSFRSLLAPFPSRGWSPSLISFKAAHI